MSEDMKHTGTSSGSSTTTEQVAQETIRFKPGCVEGYEIKPLGKCEDQGQVFLAVDLADGNAESQMVVGMVMADEKGVFHLFYRSPMKAHTAEELQAALKQMEIGKKLAGNLATLGEVFGTVTKKFNEAVNAVKEQGK